MENQTLLKLIPPTISLIITSLFGLLIGILIERFKNRFRILTYDIQTLKVIPPLSNNLGGQLKITLNDRVVSTLRVATVIIENKNSVDIDNLEIGFSLSPGAIFQGNEGYIASNRAPILWTKQYQDTFNEVLDKFEKLPQDKNDPKLKDVPKDLQPKIDYISAVRVYSIPVLNRNEKAVFNFLVEGPLDGSAGSLVPSILHKSVSLIPKGDDNKQRKKDLWLSIIIGIVTVTALISLLIYNNPNSSKLIIISAIIGLLNPIIGFTVLRSYKKIRAFFK